MKERKLNLSIDGTDPKFGGIIGQSSWSLCIGAGVSSGMVPTWAELARRVFNKVYNKNLTYEDFISLVSSSGFELNSWFQNCLNHTLIRGLPESDFYDILREELYSDLLKKAEQKGIKKQIIHGIHNPLTHFTPSEVEILHEFIENEFSSKTNSEVTRVLIESFGTRKEPNSIISFNADGILNLSIYLKQQYLSLRNPSKEISNFTRRKIKRIIQSTEMAGKNKNNDRLVPLYHLHGSLFPLVEEESEMKRMESVNKLVFDEASYINMAGSIYSWAQSTFLFHSQMDNIVFVGLSMTDTNIRKWLAWTHTNKMAEVELSHGKRKDHLRHLWITKRPSNPENEYILANSVQHLGVRIAFINDWDEIGLAMNNLIGIRKKKEHNLIQTNK